MMLMVRATGLIRVFHTILMREHSELLRAITLTRLLSSKRPPELMPSLRPTKLLLRLTSLPRLMLMLPPLLLSPRLLLLLLVLPTRIELHSVLLKLIMPLLSRPRRLPFMPN